MRIPKLAAVMATCAIVLAACQPAASPPPAGESAAAGGECLVGVSWNNYQQERWAKADEPAIQAALAAAGAEYTRTDANDSEEQQIADVESLINQEVDVIILLAKSTTSILPAVEAAKDANIPIIGYDRLIADEEVFYITFDNQGVGTAMAEAMLEAVPTGNYVVIKGHPDDPNADFLREGMDLGGLQDAVDAGDVTIVYEEYTDGWQTEVAQTNMETALQENNNEVDAVLSENDSMAIGVVAALADQGLDGVVPVSGQDGDAANLNNVARGLQLVDVWKDAFGLGKTAGFVAAQLCAGVAFEDVKAPDDLGDHVAPEAGIDAQPFDADGVTVQSITLKPTPITQENFNLVIDLGWIEADVACEGAEDGVPGCE